MKKIKINKRHIYIALMSFLIFTMLVAMIAPVFADTGNNNRYSSSNISYDDSGNY